MRNDVSNVYRRILVCDDNPDSREFIETALMTLAAPQAKFDVVLVDNGQAAFEAVKAAIEQGNPFCAAFVDHRMPMGWSGIQTARQIRSVDLDIELVMITAYDDLSKQTGALHGIGSPEKMLLLKKPLSVEEVIQTALNLSEKWYLDRVRQQQELELEQAHESLVKSYEDLKKTQDVLVHTEKMAAIGRLASGVAHEFNNIMTGVLGHAQLALASEKPMEMQEALKSITELGWRAKRITDGLLNFARKKPRQLRQGNLQQILENMLILVEKSFTGHAAKVTRDYHEIPDTSFDPDQVSQVFLNILLNARQAAGENGIEIMVGTRYTKGKILVTIADNGPGIPDDVMPRIFDPFFTTKGPLGGGKQSGSGLGLSIALGIIHEHGGDIKVDSVPKQCTKFTIIMPVVTGQDTGNKPGAPQIMVVDRDRVVASLVRDVLATDGMNVIVSDNFIRSPGYDADVVIIDPVGFDTTVLVQIVQDAMYRGLRVLLTPSITGLPVVKSLGEQGIDVLNKPYTPGELTSTVKKLVEKHLDRRRVRI